MSDHSHTNALIHETSPYLLQHSHNPVNWLAWNSESLALAKQSNKLLLISIGYSACHWCHVMERESFEDDEVATLMNAQFVCIKVDREERPDVDQIYMEAVQLMTGQGGWPLNCVALPDGKPVFGGTYFPKERWKDVLLNLARFWEEKPVEASEYAAQLTDGVRQMGFFQKLTSTTTEFRDADLEVLMKSWDRQIDYKNGGFGSAPKFPLPNSWTFLLRYAYNAGNEKLLHSTALTLNRMARGGIYDQLGGGFSRYSTDSNWMVPHFEKMLYDNAQLLGLYAEAWQCFKNPFYRQIAREIHSFISRDLKRPEGGYYAALDADSEGVEGKYYVWTAGEINDLLGDHAELFNRSYNVSPGGNWEKSNILFRSGDDRAIAEKFEIDAAEMARVLSQSRNILLKARQHRIPPGLDDKILCSWNALLISNFAQAARRFSDRQMEDEAVRELNFLLASFIVEDKLMRSFKDGKARIDAFLDDHVFLVDALLSVYECTFDKGWALLAYEWMEKTLLHFYDRESGMFWYTQANQQGLIARKQEVFDNVIPASSSVAARLLLRLSLLFDRVDFERIAKEMLAAVSEQMRSHPPSFSNWSLALLELVNGLDQIVVAGRGSKDLARQINGYYLPFCMVLANEDDATQELQPEALVSIPLLEGKLSAASGNALFYVCKGRTCQLPVHSIERALALL